MDPMATGWVKEDWVLSVTSPCVLSNGPGPSHRSTCRPCVFPGFQGAWHTGALGMCGLFCSDLRAECRDEYPVNLAHLRGPFMLCKAASCPSLGADGVASHAPRHTEGSW